MVAVIFVAVAIVAGAGALEQGLLCDRLDQLLWLWLTEQRRTALWDKGTSLRLRLSLDLRPRLSLRLRLDLRFLCACD